MRAAPLAHAVVGGSPVPAYMRLPCVPPLQWRRRRLRRLQSEPGDKRSPYGSTRSLGLTRGTVVQHLERGLACVGGLLDGRMSLHHLTTGKRLCQNAKPAEYRVRSILKRRVRLLPVP
jgi:hypothetical protein